jgi:hypothetical protein
MGQGGVVTVATTDIASFTNSTIDTSSFFAGGNAGTITVAGSQVGLQDTFLSARAENDGTTTGSGGAVTLTGTDSVALTRSFIATDSFFSNENGGAVSLGDFGRQWNDQRVHDTLEYSHRYESDYRELWPGNDQWFSRHDYW